MGRRETTGRARGSEDRGVLPAAVVRQGGARRRPRRQATPGGPVVAAHGARLDWALFTRLLERCWSAATSTQWSAASPSRGQCGVTALVVNDHVGGEILKTRVGRSWHFYNRRAGRRLNATAGQFDRPIVYLDLPSSREEALADCTAGQYRALSNNLAAALAAVRASLGPGVTVEPSRSPPCSACPTARVSSGRRGRGTPGRPAVR
jgi:hypothetical protein